MTAPSTPPAPAEQAAQQATTTALADDQVAPTHFIPTATQDNYAQIARDQARARGVEPKQVMEDLAGQFEQLHERQPLDGYDHLAAWARDFDPAVGGPPSGLAVLQARALESARRDPYQAVIGDQALVEQAVASQQALDEGLIGVTQSPTVEGSGLLLNSGPLPVGGDASPFSPDPAVAEQQRAAQQQYDQQDSGGTGTPAPAPTSTSTDTITSTPTPPAKRNGTTSTGG